MEWKIDLKPVGQGALIEQAKVEALRKLAEQIEHLEKTIQEIWRKP